MTSETEHAAGVQFFPLTQTIHVDKSPQGGFIFSQLRATVTGEIRCLADAGKSCLNDLLITLSPLNANGNVAGQPIRVEPVAGKYSFTNILPGSYEVSVPKSKLCWQESAFKINVKTTQESVPTFVHNGYMISIVSSHATNMNYKLRAEKAKSEELLLKSDLNTFCVPNAGTYDISFSGCHKYEENVAKTFSTSDATPASVTAHKHRNTIKILAEETYTYSTKVTFGDSVEKIDFKPTNERVDGLYVYKHDFFLERGETINLEPVSDIMLFNPTSLEVTGGSDCSEVPVKIYATKGLLINGKTNPPIKDAKITLLFPKNAELSPLVVLTNAEGGFKFGPIDSSLTVELSAEKESYVFSAFDKATNSFNGHKLCEIIVTVKDDAGNQLPGVLLSLSGAESYRKNLVTGK